MKQNTIELYGAWNVKRIEIALTKSAVKIANIDVDSEWKDIFNAIGINTAQDLLDLTEDKSRWHGENGIIADKLMLDDVTKIAMTFRPQDEEVALVVNINPVNIEVHASAFLYAALEEDDILDYVRTNIMDDYFYGLPEDADIEDIVGDTCLYFYSHSGDGTIGKYDVTYQVDSNAETIEVWIEDDSVNYVDVTMHLNNAEWVGLGVDDDELENIKNNLIEFWKNSDGFVVHDVIDKTYDAQVFRSSYNHAEWPLVVVYDNDWVDDDFTKTIKR